MQESRVYLRKLSTGQLVEASLVDEVTDRHLAMWNGEWQKWESDWRSWLGRKFNSRYDPLYKLKNFRVGIAVGDMFE